jgi:hypothetical protein
VSRKKIKGYFRMGNKENIIFIPNHALEKKTRNNVSFLIVEL